MAPYGIQEIGSPWVMKPLMKLETPHELFRGGHLILNYKYREVLARYGPLSNSMRFVPHGP